MFMDTGNCFHIEHCLPYEQLSVMYKIL